MVKQEKFLSVVSKLHEKQHNQLLLHQIVYRKLSKQPVEIICLLKQTKKKIVPWNEHGTGTQHKIDTPLTQDSCKERQYLNNNMATNQICIINLFVAL